MEIKRNRIVSFAMITIIYILSIVAGLVVYLALPLAPWISLLIADIVATVVTFLFSCLFKNASVYDPYWSVQPVVILIAFAIGNTMSFIKIATLLVVCIWGIRLTANWAYTFQGMEHQDWRYTMYQNRTGKWYPVVNFFGIHLMPTLIVYSCTLPAVFIMQSVAPNNWASIILIISYSAVILQGCADWQMHKFRKNRTCEIFIGTGLWKYSRHPNYLGEILMWWGIALTSVFALGVNWWFLIIGAFINTLLFLFISIPLADGRQSKKEGFAEYKRKTRMLLPIKRFK